MHPHLNGVHVHKHDFNKSPYPNVCSIDNCFPNLFDDGIYTYYVLEYGLHSDGDISRTKNGHLKALLCAYS